MKTVAFIILNYKTTETTVNLVDSLLKWKQNRFRRKLIVVDNCSPDDSFEQLRERYQNLEDVDVLKSERNGGYSYGNNFGARFAIETYHPDYIAIANPDIIVDEDTVASLLDTFGQDDLICGCSPVMKNLQGEGEAKTNRLPTYRDDLRVSFTELRPGKHEDEPKELVFLDDYPDTVLTESLPGSFFVVQTDRYSEVGMLDENVFLFCEERILGFRVKQRGWKFATRADLSFQHIHGASIGKSLKALRTRRIMLDSRLYYEKTYNRVGFVRLLWLRIVMWASLAVMYLLGVASSAKRKLSGTQKEK